MTAFPAGTPLPAHNQSPETNCLTPNYHCRGVFQRTCPRSTTSRTKGLSPQISWHNCTIPQFHNLNTHCFRCLEFRSLGVVEAPTRRQRITPCAPQAQNSLALAAVDGVEQFGVAVRHHGHNADINAHRPSAALQGDIEPD